MAAYDTFVGLPLDQSVQGATWDAGGLTWLTPSYLAGDGNNGVKVTGAASIISANFLPPTGTAALRVFFKPASTSPIIPGLTMHGDGSATSQYGLNGIVLRDAGAAVMEMLNASGSEKVSVSYGGFLSSANEYCLEITFTAPGTYVGKLYNSANQVRGTVVATLPTLTLTTARPSTAKMSQLWYGNNTNMSITKVETVDGVSPVSFSGPVPTRNGVVGTAASFTNAGFFAGSATPFTYSSVGAVLPAGLTLDASTGVISGTPTAAGTTSGIIVRATDANSATADTNSYSIVIAASNAAPTFPGTIANITGTAGTAITQVNVSGQFNDSDALTYSASPAGTTWPSGLTINATTGVISGTVSAASTTTGLKVRATDTASQTVDSNAFSVTINAAAPTTGSFKTLPLANNTGTLYAAGTAVVWTWEQGGRVGSAPTSSTYGAGTVSADGTVTATGLPIGAGLMRLAIRGATYDMDKVYYQPGTVT